MDQKPKKTPARLKPLIPGTEAPKPPRMRPALRIAVDEIVYKGVSVPDAAKRSGMHVQALYRALKRPDIAAYVEYLKAAAIVDGTDLRQRAKAMAIRVGLDLLHNATSEGVKARMVEFFAGEPKSPAVAVQINAHHHSPGYIYKRPEEQGETVDRSPPEGPTK